MEDRLGAAIPSQEQGQLSPHKLAPALKGRQTWGRNGGGWRRGAAGGGDRDEGQQPRAGHLCKSPSSILGAEQCQTGEGRGRRLSSSFLIMYFLGFLESEGEVQALMWLWGRSVTTLLLSLRGAVMEDGIPGPLPGNSRAPCVGQRQAGGQSLPAAGPLSLCLPAPSSVLRSDAGLGPAGGLEKPPGQEGGP